MPSALGSPCQESQQQSVNVPTAQQADCSTAREGVWAANSSQWHDAVAAVHALVVRLLGQQHAQLFSLALVPCTPKAPHGHFTVCVRDGTVHVSGTSGVQLASGVHWFLKYFARCSVSWELTGGVQVSASRLSAAGLASMAARGTVTVERAVPLSFYQNVVTMSYSMAFWEWDRCADLAVQLC
jgi:alpha-N-acetylglucosaminidase